jgi:DNA invertase Pin-like site-specific DNA recombinase
LLELRQYVAARGWTAIEYIGHGVSGSKDRRPALNQLVADVRRHRIVLRESCAGASIVLVATCGISYAVL